MFNAICSKAHEPLEREFQHPRFEVTIFSIEVGTEMLGLLGDPLTTKWIRRHWGIAVRISRKSTLFIVQNYQNTSEAFHFSDTLACQFLSSRTFMLVPVVIIYRFKAYYKRKIFNSIIRLFFLNSVFPPQLSLSFRVNYRSVFLPFYFFIWAPKLSDISQKLSTQRPIKFWKLITTSQRLFLDAESIIEKLNALKVGFEQTFCIKSRNSAFPLEIP